MNACDVEKDANAMVLFDGAVVSYSLDARRLETMLVSPTGYEAVLRR